VLDQFGKSGWRRSVFAGYKGLRCYGEW
jgi:hypothetical protein